MEGEGRRPVVFLDIAIGRRNVGRLIIELFSDVVPRTAENFRQMCTGEHRRQGVPIGYKGAPFHRVIRGFMVQGGDFVRGDGTGSTCIYGDHFADEHPMGSHDQAGLLSMANSGPNSNGCQFFITTGECTFLDGKHVVFGRVKDGMNIVRLIEQVPTTSSLEGNRPKVPVVIEQCGEM